ncbi:MAG: c-type cytochrome [Rhodothermales bacterium]
MSDQHIPPSQSGASDPDNEPLISGHSYDGIEEYDNPMPGWWLWLFWLCVLFAPIYVLGVHFFGFINTYEDDLADSQAAIQEVRDAWEAENPTFEVSNEAIAAYIGVDEHIQAGAQVYSANCSMCHGNDGEGLIGPNLTDAYWIHGNQNVDLFNVITNGVLDKGMTPWGGVLTPEQRSQLVAYIRSIEGTEPENAKAAEGEFYGDEENGDDDDTAAPERADV